MKKHIEVWFLKNWYQTTISFPMLLLLPFSYLFRSIIFLRRLFYQVHLLKSYSVSVPVIVVGNISIGGTGKTPCVIALANHLTQKGFQVGIISRGYGAMLSKPTLVNPDSSAVEVGDEPLLLAQKTHCPVMVSPDRVASARQLINAHHCGLIISDDGLQHYRLVRDINIAVADSVRQFGNHQCLPAGPLREPVKRIRAFDLFIWNGIPLSEKTSLDEYCMKLLDDGIFSVRSKKRVDDVEALKEMPIHAIAGIGHPERFFTLLKQAGFLIEEHRFPDHHPYGEEDLCFSNKKPMLMTEKDAVKCAFFAKEDYYYLAVRAHIPEAFFDQLDRLMEKVLS